MDSIPQTSGIYVITCTANGKIYIGSTSDFRRRWAEHRRDLRSNQHDNQYLQNAWNKYGESLFTFAVVCKCDCENLTEVEQMFLDTYAPYGKRGFNIAVNAEKSGKGLKRSAEFRAKLRAAKKNMSAEYRAKLSVAARGNIKGKNPSTETRAKLSAAHSRLWIVVAPDGQECQIKGLRKFCAAHGLDHGCMVRVAQGVCSQHKGWKCRYA